MFKAWLSGWLGYEKCPWHLLWLRTHATGATYRWLALVRVVRKASRSSLLLLDACKLDVLFPVLDLLQEQRLAFLGRVDERIAAEAVEEFLGLVGLDTIW